MIIYVSTIILILFCINFCKFKKKITKDSILKKNKIITDEDIAQISNESLGQPYWEFQLGVGLKYEYETSDIKFHAPYPQLGKILWKAFKYELYNILCESKSKEPKEWLNDLITGDIRNLIVNICSAITTKYDISLGISLPVAALIFKHGVLRYCDAKPKKSKKSVLEILREMRPE